MSTPDLGAIRRSDARNAKLSDVLYCILPLGLENEVKKLEARIEKLEATLRRVAAYGNDAPTVSRIARAALAADPPTEGE